MGTDEQALPTRSCANCGLQNPPGNRFCGNCGGHLAAREGAAGVAPAVAGTPSAEGLSDESVPLAPPPVAPLAPQAAVAAVVPAIAPVAPAVPRAPTATPVAPATPSPVRSATVAPPEAALSGIARERERDRLLTLANVQRMRDQSTEARKTLQQALILMEGMPGHQIAPIHELIGDLYDAEAHWDDARIAYNTAHELDPKRVSAERKYAALTLRVAETKPGSSLAEAVLRGESIADLLATGALSSERGRRNAGMAMFLSVAIPGFGQFYNGEIVKGAIILAVFAATLLYFAISPDHEAFVHKFAAILALSRGHAANATVSPFSILVGVLMIGDWLYAIVDAPFTASKSAATGTDSNSVIDKRGWEV